MELMKLINPLLVNLMSSCRSHMIPKTLSIGMSFKSKLTTFYDLSAGVMFLKYVYYLTTA